VEPLPVTLVGQFVRLEPLRPEHVGELCEIGLDPDLWRLSLSDIRTPADMERYVQNALRLQAEGSALPFLIRERTTGRAAGCTRFGNVERAHRRLEIGWTWIAAPWQRTAINTEAKYLLLRHAFETLGMIRVEIKVDALNERSRNAVLRIGAREEGTLRSHMITETGRIRDTVFFSILAGEWPAVKSALEEKLARPAESLRTVR
jgi:RimJ/RimL family protein N-acetyltransferase